MTAKRFRIAYVAKHGSGGNEDERAIKEAFEFLGHKVIPIYEKRAEQAARQQCDFVLFHHLDYPERLSRINHKVVWWCFDLITEKRRAWADSALDVCHHAFLSDGDYIQDVKHLGSHFKSMENANKLCWMMQGADQTLSGAYTQLDGKEVIYGGIGAPVFVDSYPIEYPDIIFTGSPHTPERRTWVKMLQDSYKDRFLHISYGMYGMKLRCMILDRYRVVVAPDSPVSDDYWSNRVYIAMGNRACVVHPYCAKLAEQYKDGEEIIFYRSRPELLDNLDCLIASPSEVERVAKAGHERTCKEHTYIHRCQELIQKVAGL